MQISLLLMERDCKAFCNHAYRICGCKAGLMKSSSKSISVVMVYLVIPCVIIDAFQVDYTPDVKRTAPGMCGSSSGTCLFLILTTILKQVLQLDTIERATLFIQMPVFW